MLIKIIILSTFLLTGCGKEVSIPNDLEKSSLKQQSQEAIKEGTLSKGAVNSITVAGKPYKVSEFSSKNASDYIQNLPAGDHSVRFRGDIQNEEIVIKRFY